MVTLKTVVNVKGITSKTICDFMLNCTDVNDQRWSARLRSFIILHRFFWLFITKLKVYP